VNNRAGEGLVVMSAEQLRGEVLARIAREPSPTRPERRRRSALLAGLTVAATAAVFTAFGGVRPHARPLSLVMATASGTVLLAVIALAVVFGRRSAMLGRSRPVLLATIAGLPLALVLWKVGVSALYDGMTAVWPDRPGFRCLALSLSAALTPLMLAMAARRRTDPVRPGITGAALGAACGLAAAVLVDLWCPVAHLGHLLLGHLLPIVLLAAAGAAVGSRVLGLRFQPTRR
jgi:hypothetical protein